MKLNDVIKTENQIKALNHSIENNMIERVDINVIAHFGNCPCFEIMCKNVFPMSNYNTTKNLGYIVKAFIELFDLSEEDGIRIGKIKDLPCRLVFQGIGGWGSRCIGFGHFMKDKFVLTEDFAKIDS